MAHISPSASVMLAACSTTADSVGTPAPPSEPGDITDMGISIDEPSAPGSETETDTTAEDALLCTTSTDDYESPTADSVGTPALPSEPGDITDMGISVDEPSAPGFETETDTTAEDALLGTTSTDDYESPTADSVGTPALPSEPGDSTDVGISVDELSAPRPETEMDMTAEDAPSGMTSTDDSKSPTSGETDSSGPAWSLEVSDDSWIEDWDMTIHRCSHCDRPFVSAARLAQHVQAWHTARAPVLRPYRKPPSDTDAGSGELVVIASHGDLFLSVSEGPAQSGSQGVRFRVTSSILTPASRVFNSMFGPTSRFQEAIALRRSHITGFPPVVVALDDDPETLKYVLTALHFPYAPLSIPTYELMVEVAVICDKYELHQALQPVADQYFLPIGMEISNFSGSINWLLISYVFGYEQIFAAVSKYIILRLTDAEQTAYVDCRTPEKVIGMTRFVPPSASAIAD